MRVLTVLLAIATMISGCPGPEEGLADAGALDIGAAADSGGKPDATETHDDAAIQTDAAEVDAANLDAEPLPDATPPPEVTIRTLTDEGAFAGVPVVFHDSTGAVLNTSVTNALGVARGAIEAGGQVSVLFRGIMTTFGTGDSIQTIYDVNPGDEITLRSEQPYDETIVGNVVIDFPGAFPGADHYDTEVACSGTTTLDPGRPIQSALYEDCVRTATVVSVIGYARDANTNVIAFATVDGIPVATGARAPLSAWRTDFSTVELNVINVPNESIVAFPGLSLISGFAQHSYSGQGQFVPSISPGTTIRSFPLGDAQRLFMSLQMSSGFAELDAILPRSDLITFDFATDLLPFPANLMVHNSTTARPRITWTRSSTAGVDLVHSRFQVRDGIEWQVWSPPDRTELQLPELPDAYGMYRPTANDMPRVYSLQHIDHSRFLSWDDVKRGFDAFHIDRQPWPGPSERTIGTRSRYSETF